MQEAYKVDLAYIHDEGFGHFARGAVVVLLAALRQAGIKNRLIVDLGCGSGILSQEVKNAGYEVLGLDISEQMIARAKRRVPQGQFLVTSFFEAELPSCGAVAAIGECFNYLFDHTNSHPKLLDLFTRIYHALEPGGIFLFDVAEPGRVSGPNPQQHFVEGKDWVVLVTAEEDSEKQLLTRRIITFRQVDKLYRRDEEVHTLRLIRRESVEEALHSLGFRTNLLESYEKVKFKPGHIGFLACKPKMDKHECRH